MNKLIILAIVVLIVLSIILLLTKRESFRNLISDEILKGNLGETSVYYDIDN